MTSRTARLGLCYGVSLYSPEQLERAYSIACQLESRMLLLCEPVPHDHDLDCLDMYGVCVWCRRRPDLG